MPITEILGEEIENDNDRVNWFGRVMVGGMSVLGLVAIANKIGGPTGKAIKLSVGDQLEEEVIDAVNKYGRQADKLKSPSSLKHKLPINGKLEVVGKLPSEQAISKFERVVNSQDKINKMMETPTSLYNKIHELERSISTVINGVENGDPMMKQINALHGIVSAKVRTKDAKSDANNYLLMATKINAMRDYSTTDVKGELAQYLDEDIWYDNFLTEMKPSDMIKWNQNNETLIKSDTSYAKKYYKQLQNLEKEILANKIASSANSNKALELTHNKLYVKDAFMPVGDLLNDAAGYVINVTNKSIELFSSDFSNNKMSVGEIKQVIDKSISKNVGLKSQYGSELSDIAHLLDQFKTMSNGKITNVKMTYKTTEQRGVEKAYVVINIDRKYGNNNTRSFSMNIPLVDKFNIVPDITNTSHFGYGVAGIIESLPGTNKPATAIDISTYYMRTVKDMLTQSIMSEVLFTDEESFNDVQKKLRRPLLAIQDQLSALNGEARDIFATGMYIPKTHLDLIADKTGSKKRQLADGAKTIINMFNDSKRNTNNDVSIVLDLETIQLLGNGSGRYMSVRNTTSIWSVGFSIFKGNELIDGDQISSMHALKEHDLLRAYEVDKVDKGYIARMIDENPNIRKFARFAQKTVGGSTGDDSVSLAIALKKHIEMVLDESNGSLSKVTTMPGMGNFSSSVEFAQSFVKMLKAKIRDLQDTLQPGAKITLETANGTDFDIRLLETLTGDMGSIRDMVEFKDITNVSRTMKFGKKGMLGDQLMHIVNQLAWDQGYDKEHFNVEANPLEALKQLQKNGLMKTNKNGGDILKFVGGKIKGNMGLHNSALLDTVMTKAAVILAENVIAKDTSHVDKAYEILNLLEKYQRKDYEATIADYMESSLGVINGKQVTKSGISMQHRVDNYYTHFNVADVMPLLANNPVSKQANQYLRHGWFQKNVKAAYWRYGKMITSPIEEVATDLAYRTTGFDKNRFANKVILNTAYTIGGYGMQSGYSAIPKFIDDEFDQMLYNQKRVQFNFADTDFPDASMSNTIREVYDKAMVRARKMMSDKGLGPVKSKHKISKSVLEEAFRIELGNIQNKESLILDPENPIHQNIMFGDGKLNIKQNTPGKLVGIELGGDINNDKPASMLLLFDYKSSLNLQIDHLPDNKSVVTKLQHVDQEVLRTMGRKYTHGLIESQVDMRTIEKGYTGELQRKALLKIIGHVNKIGHIGSSDASKRVWTDSEKFASDKIMKKVISLFKEKAATDGMHVGSIDEENGFKSFIFGALKPGTVDVKEQMNMLSTIKMSDIMDIFGEAGGDLIHDYKSLKEYYGLFSNDGIIETAHNIDSKLVAKGFSEKGTKEGDLLEQMLNMDDTIKENKALINPFQAAANKYNRKHGDSALQKKLQGYIDANDLQSADNLIKKLKIGKLFQAVGDMSAVNRNIMAGKTGDERFDKLMGIVVPTIHHFSDSQSMKQKQVNKTIKFRANYFDTIFHENYLPERVKQVLASSQGWKADKAGLDLVKTSRAVIDMFKNNNLSKLMTNYSLNQQQMLDIIGNPLTNKQIDRALERLSLADGKSSKRKAAIISEVIDSIKKTGTTISLEEEEEIRSRSINYFKDKLIATKNRPSSLSATEALHVISLSEDQNAKVVGLKFYEYKELDKDTGKLVSKVISKETRAKLIKKGISKDQFKSWGGQIRFDLEDMISRLNEKESDPFNLRQFIDHFSHLKNTPGRADNRIFNVKEVNGRKIIEMNALVMPMFSDIRNVFNQIGDVEGYGVATKEFKLMQEVANGLKDYANSFIDGKGNNSMNNRTGDDLAFNYFQMLGGIMNFGKDSQLFDAVKKFHLVGSRHTYGVSDQHVLLAQYTLKGIDGKSTGSKQRMLDFFKKNNMDASQQSAFMDQIRSVALSDGHTALVNAEDFFGDNIKVNTGNGKSMTFGQMLSDAKANDKHLYNELLKIQNGRATMPGFTGRYPIPSAGELGLSMVNILGLSREVMDFLGMSTDMTYFNSVIAEARKADTDGDETELMQLGYRTIEHLNEMRAATKESHARTVGSHGLQYLINEYNRSGALIGKEMKGGVEYYKVGKLAPNGSMIEELVTKDEYFNKFDSGISKNFKKILSQDWIEGTNIHNIANGVERHLATGEIGTAAQSLIGLISNTMSERVKDLHRLNKILPDNVPTDINFLDSIQSIKFGMANMHQTAIAMGKHNTFEKAINLAHAIGFWESKVNNKQASREQVQAAEKAWMHNFYDDWDTKKLNPYWEKNDETRAFVQKQQDLFNTFKTAMPFIDQVYKKDPQIGRYLKNESDLSSGKMGTDITAALWNESMDHGIYDDAISHINSSTREATAELIQHVIDKQSGDFKYDNGPTKRSKAFNHFYTNNNIHVKNAMMHGGKFAAFGMLAVAALNMFKPMAGTGIDAPGVHNNFTASELQLDRRIAIDQVDASFSKEAFAYMNDQDSTAREKKSLYGATQLAIYDNLIRPEPTHKQFRSNLNIQQINRMTYIGPFGNSNFDSR